MSLISIPDPFTPGAFDANPAAFAYELHVNRQWGMKRAPSEIDEGSFLVAAAKLRDEAFGISLAVDDGRAAKEVLREIARHVECVFFRDMRSGLFTMRLVRDDYEPSALPILTEDDILSVENLSGEGYGNLTDEIRLTYTDRAQNYTEGRVYWSNTGVYHAQGRSNSQDLKFPFIHNRALAAKVAAREGRFLSTPLKKIKLRASRAARNLNPGDVFRVQFPELSLEDVIFRVNKVRRGGLLMSEIAIEALQDVFGFADSVYGDGPPSLWIDPRVEPEPAALRRIMEQPYWFSRSETPRAVAWAVAPNNSHASYDLEVRDAADGDFTLRESAQPFVASSVLSRDFSSFQDPIGGTLRINAVAALDGLSGAGVQAALNGANLMVIDNEILSFMAIEVDDSEAVLSGVRHGLLDTTPADHAAGARVFFIEDALFLDDALEVGAEITGRFLTNTFSGQLAPEAATTDALVISERARRPSPPGFLRVNGVYRGSAAVGFVHLEWAHRNRLTQGEVIPQSFPNVAPEPGTTYVVRVYGETGALIRTATGIAGNEFHYREAQMIADCGAIQDRLRFEVEAVRAGLVSFQSQSIAIEYLES
jgi:hypothetical protein